MAVRRGGGAVRPPAGPPGGGPARRRRVPPPPRSASRNLGRRALPAPAPSGGTSVAPPQNRDLRVVLVAGRSVWRPGAASSTRSRNEIHNVEGNKATIDSFTQNLQTRRRQPFEATYTTRGALRRVSSTPSTRRAAVWRSTGRRPGANSSSVQLIVNTSGDYSCSQSGSAGHMVVSEAGTGRRHRGTEALRHLHPLALDLLPQGCRRSRPV